VFTSRTLKTQSEGNHEETITMKKHDVWKQTSINLL